MKNRFGIFKNRSRGGIYYLKEKKTGKRDSLETKDRDRALELLTAHNEAGPTVESVGDTGLEASLEDVIVRHGNPLQAKRLPSE